MSVIWATRGRDWGFLFLRCGGADDPLVAYEEIFAAMGSSPSAHRASGGKVGVRFPDPEGRQDRAGRVIPHEFLLTGTDAEGIDSVDDALAVLWPQMADDYARVWDSPRAPEALD